MIRKFWNALSKQNVGYVLLWNLPLGILVLSYEFAVMKLIFLKGFNFKIGHWNQKTELAIESTLWIYHHIWILLLYTIVLNSAFLFIPRTKSFRYLWWLTWLILAVPALWYARLGMYLFSKVITL